MELECLSPAHLYLILLRTQKTMYIYIALHTLKTHHIYSLQELRQLRRPARLVVTQRQVQLECGHRSGAHLQRSYATRVARLIFELDEHTAPADAARLLLGHLHHIGGDAIEQIDRQQHLGAGQISRFRRAQLRLKPQRQFADGAVVRMMVSVVIVVVVVAIPI